jgi:hypothetical protein
MKKFPAASPGFFSALNPPEEPESAIYETDNAHEDKHA